MYEHGLGRVRADQSEFDREDNWAGLSIEDLIRRAVREVAARFRENAPLLRPVVLLSSDVPEVAARGSAYCAGFEEQFVGLLNRAIGGMSHSEPKTAVPYCSDAAFSSWVVRVAYGPKFSALELDDGFHQRLQDLAVEYFIR